MSGPGIKTMFDAGKARVQKLNADQARVDFIKRLSCDGGRAGIVLTPIEHDFVGRIIQNHRNVADLHPGDQNICDSFRRRFEHFLNGFAAGSARGKTLNSNR